MRWLRATGSGRRRPIARSVQADKVALEWGERRMKRREFLGALDGAAAWPLTVQAQPPAPGDLPVQSPAQFEFVLNMRAAKEVGLSIPPAVRTRATEILE